MVGVERSGLLDDPSYIKGLDKNDPIRRNENVFGFSMDTAGREVTQLLHAVVAPSGLGNSGAHLYHFATGSLDQRIEGCNPGCLYSGDLLATGDRNGLVVTGAHTAAEVARAARAAYSRRPVMRIRRAINDLLWRLI
jgi:hypothetical protein